MSEEPTEWIAHIDQANRLYFEEKVKPAIETCKYFQTDACDCSGKCMYDKKETN